ncbi:MAG: cytochrome b/b6 domain-containing protein [Gammaproteobacteria bacterium]|nr:cytochrome b/b6 domain-containing protein [Gammaproteobacteria bacterium]MCW8909160.1 cytochrome b/b6 domain-containing protein [Gammaproteobacteria bacterium]MCW9004610.1 cytochrome b/b6 domain-containing protein [Gammaproteobacteria bacterium]MCW9055618.1 cytochrome b/b6 domain-containing protein [Gammaproteobacteria bacterium]
MAERIYIFKRFERFWHWSQALLIIFMMLTGFEVHGVYSLFGFQAATELHTIAAWTLVSLWVFAIFWHFTTGEWKQYIPTMEKVDQMLKFYLTGIFTDAPHPFKQTTVRKHNPLQRLAYLFVLAIINPLIWTTGWFYLFYGSWGNWGFGWLSLEWVAFFHVIAAFMMLIFFIAHIYLATAGHTVTSHIKAMITGWEEVED